MQVEQCFIIIIINNNISIIIIIIIIISLLLTYKSYKQKKFQYRIHFETEQTSGAMCKVKRQ